MTTLEASQLGPALVGRLKGPAKRFMLSNNIKNRAKDIPTRIVAVVFLVEVLSRNAAE